MYSSREWTKTRVALLDDMVSLVDVGKVWKEVKLEQCIYILHHKSNRSDYAGLVRCGNDIASTTTIEKTTLELFGVFPSVVSHSEMNLALKMRKFQMLGEYVVNRRGASLAKHKTENGDMVVVGGKEIQRYFINGVRFRVDAADTVQDDKASVSDRSVLVQRIVAHISKPVDRIRIIATIPPDPSNLLIEETINHLVVNEDVSPLFVLGLLHSKVINWYLYRFVISKSIRSINFDPPTTNKIPIKVSNEDEVCRCVKALLACHDGPVNGSGVNTEAQKLVNELDRLFYGIFDLTPEEIRIVEEVSG